MFDKNVYYNPEKFGLKVLAEIELSEPCYSFNTRVVWLHSKSGVKYTAQDSGCSCPTPFENFHGLESLDRLDITTLVNELKECDYPTQQEKAQFLAAIK